MNTIVRGHRDLTIDAGRIHDPKAQLSFAEPARHVRERRRYIAHESLAGLGYRMAQQTIAIAAHDDQPSSGRIPRCGRERLAYRIALNLIAYHAIGRYRAARKHPAKSQKKPLSCDL